MAAPGLRLLALVVAAGLSTIAGRARADLVPPREHAEACTLQKQARAGTECLACSAFFGNPEHCSASLASYGFAQSCRTGGASQWSEVWCRAKVPGAAKVPPEVLGQLDNPKTGLRPAAVATAVPVAATAAPVVSAATLPVAPLVASVSPVASSTPVPAETSVPGPQPVPPPATGCACAAGGAEASLPALMLAMSAAAAAAMSRRRRRG